MPAPSAAGKQAKKNRKKKARALAQKQAEQQTGSQSGSEDDMPVLEDLSAFPKSPQQQLFGSAPFPAATQQELLATANELYRQIETAAAAALASTPNVRPATNPTTARPILSGDETDDAYWSSLPAHLRSFIKNALPLAAGLAPNGPNSAAPGTFNAAQALNLSPEQMHQAAQQLAQVVQSTGWASLGVPPVTSSQSRSAQASATTTIPLGSFTLPLHPHPNHAPTNDDYQDLDVEFTDEEYSEGEEDDDLDEDDQDDDLPPPPPLKSVSAKATSATPVPDSSKIQTPRQAIPSTAQPAARRTNPPAPTRSAVPVVPQLSSANTTAKKTVPNPNATTAQQAPSAVRPANSAAQAQAIRERAQAAAIAQASSNAVLSSNLAAKAAANSEREKIRDFWLALSETERRSLVKVEKESVLRKMKEQQKHGCSCAVCGRKRSAIEEELEVLYDAYYDELEQYAFQQQRYKNSNGSVPPPPGPGPFPGSVDTSAMQPMASAASQPKQTAQRTATSRSLPNGAARGHTCAQHSQPHTHRPGVKCNGHHPPAKPQEEDDDADEDEYDDDDEEEEEEDYDEEEYDDEEDPSPPVANPPPRSAAKPTQRGTGVVGLGDASLAVKNGGILTVADDLLKNDGQKFLEMMESLADKRIQREREAFDILDGEDDIEDDDEYDEDTEDEDAEDDEDEDEEDALTEEQRTSEGRRMFQIFAARMFEQRVLQAYREQVAQERQQQLLLELAAEDQAAADKDAKKAKDAQRKKDKKKAQKEKAEADKAKKDQEKQAAAEAEASALALKAEEDRRRALEQQRKDEEKRKAREAEIMRKEEEKRKRVEKQEREAREKREKEDRLKAAREAKMTKEREAKAKEKEQRERKGKEEAARKEALRKEQEAAIAAAAAKRKADEEQQELEREAERNRLTAAAAMTQPSASTSRSIPGGRSSPPALRILSNGKGPANRQAPQPAVARPVPSGPNQANLRSASTKVNGASSTNLTGRMLNDQQIQQPNVLPPRSPLPPGLSNSRPPMPVNMPQQMQPPFGRPPSAGSFPGHPQGMMPMPQPMSTSTAGPNTPRMNGMASPHNGPPGAFGAIGVGPAPSHLRSPVPPQMSGSFAPMGMQMPPGLYDMTSPVGQTSSIAPIGIRSNRQSLTSPIISTASSLAALNIGSQPVRAGVTSQPAQPRRVSPQDLQPIGFKRNAGSHASDVDDDTEPPSTSASLHSASPPPILGSAALLEDFEEVPEAEPSSSPNLGGFPGTSAFAPSSWAADNGIWGVPASSAASGWREPAAAPAAVQDLERSDIIRARSGIACLQLNETTGRFRHTAQDVYRVLLSAYPDSASVDLGELIQSCAMAANPVNGGGHFEIAQDGPTILLSFDPSRIS